MSFDHIQGEGATREEAIRDALARVEMSRGMGYEVVKMTGVQREEGKWYVRARMVLTSRSDCGTIGVSRGLEKEG